MYETEKPWRSFKQGSCNLSPCFNPFSTQHFVHVFFLIFISFRFRFYLPLYLSVSFVWVRLRQDHLGLDRFNHSCQSCSRPAWQVRWVRSETNAPVKFKSPIWPSCGAYDAEVFGFALQWSNLKCRFLYSISEQGMSGKSHHRFDLKDFVMEKEGKRFTDGRTTCLGKMELMDTNTEKNRDFLAGKIRDRGPEYLKQVCLGDSTVRQLVWDHGGHCNTQHRSNQPDWHETWLQDGHECLTSGFIM